MVFDKLLEGFGKWCDAKVQGDQNNRLNNIFVIKKEKTEQALILKQYFFENQEPVLVIEKQMNFQKIGIPYLISTDNLKFLVHILLMLAKSCGITHKKKAISPS